MIKAVVPVLPAALCPQQRDVITGKERKKKKLMQASNSPVSPSAYEVSEESLSGIRNSLPKPEQGEEEIFTNPLNSDN